MVLLGGAPISVSVIGYPAEYLWWWYAYASAFDYEAQWADAQEIVEAAAETAHAAAVTPDALETVEAATESANASTETAHALETVEAATN